MVTDLISLIGLIIPHFLCI